ncbi:MAG: DedA family protein [Deltaproteobacteria bacterium]|nr:DedA family protein [Deltaproteobacteria bacterium]
MVKRLYDWVLKWSGTRYAVPALAILAVAEASFFPIPPDVLLIAMAFALPRRAFWYAGVCSVASVLGGVGGYAIGRGLMDVLGCRLVALYKGQATFDWLAGSFAKYDFWAVFVAAVTPIPYKIFTITAGAMEMDLGTFVGASALGRPARFFAVALLIYLFGPVVRRFLEKYFNLVATVFVVLLIGGFVLMGTLGKHEEKESEAAPASPYARICGAGEEAAAADPGPAQPGGIEVTSPAP